MHKYHIPSRRTRPPLTALRNLEIHKVFLRLHALPGTTAHRRYITRTYASLYERYTSGTIEKRQRRALKKEKIKSRPYNAVCCHYCPANPQEVKNPDNNGHLLRIYSPVGAIYCVVPRAFVPGEISFFTPDRLFKASIGFNTVEKSSLFSPGKRLLPACCIPGFPAAIQHLQIMMLTIIF